MTKRKPSLDKLHAVIMEFLQPDGSILRRTLSNKQAIQWQEWITAVCMLAWNYSANPKWDTLKWSEKLIHRRKHK